MSGVCRPVMCRQTGAVFSCTWACMVQWPGNWGAHSALGLGPVLSLVQRQKKEDVARGHDEFGREPAPFSHTGMEYQCQCFRVLVLMFWC